MTERAAEQPHPEEVFGRRVIEVCPDCEGEGRLWGVDEEASTHWADRCKLCNCVGYILDMPLDSPELDQEDIPF